MVTFPVVPIDPISKASVDTLQVKSIQVGVVTGTIPPGTREPLCTILAPSIIISIDCAELCTTGRKTFAQVRAEINKCNLARAE